jgi:hypothetical protein
MLAKVYDSVASWEGRDSEVRVSIPIDEFIETVVNI